MNSKVVVKVALGLPVVLALAAVVLLVIVGLSIWHTVAHGDEETQMKTAAEVLSCDPSTIKISGMRAEGCGRATSVHASQGWPTLCQTGGSGAARHRARNGRLRCSGVLFAGSGFGFLTLLRQRRHFHHELTLGRRVAQGGP
jgi:hypothetical protein